MKKFVRTLAQSVFSSEICSALHFNTGSQAANNSAGGIFYAVASYIGSVPCGALMRPLPVSRCNATGSGTFIVSSPQKSTSLLIF